MNATHAPNAMTITHADPIAALIIGETPAVRRLRALVARLAPTALPVLVHGPTGAGKELVARALHLASGRTGRHVAFNVCAVAESMFEDALFGHVKGAFTGAAGDSPGFLAEANGGTVFLDEIGELPMAPQAKLLRALETHEFRPVGARHDRRSDFRVVAATNRPLTALAAEGQFRLDLLHRLSGFVLELPALAARLDDLPLLARHLLHALPGRAGAELSAGAVALLQQQAWPGNVRELRHVVERAAILSATNAVGREAVAEALELAAAHAPIAHDAPAGFAQRRLLEVLEHCGWDTVLAAEQLSVHRATVYRRMKRLGIDTTRADDVAAARDEARARMVGLPSGYSLAAVRHDAASLELT
jgi:DNA-binding NtrC family response regulator